MSFFAVLDVEESEARKRFVVDALHVNVWSLVGFGHRTLIVDVGVKITAEKRKPVSGLSLAIPFRNLITPIDLANELTENTTASLIFDAVAFHNPQTKMLQVNQEQMVLLRRAASSGKEEVLSNAAMTVWKVDFVEPLQGGTTGYFRMRFEVDNSRSWENKRIGRRDLLIDLRVSDIRSTLELAEGETIRDRIMNISRAYIFAVLPQALAPMTLSPDPNYIRLLEPRVWGRYLDRKAEFRRRRLVVYQWKNDGGTDDEPKDVTIEEPMRLYGHFQRTIRFPWLRLAFLTALIAVGALVAFFKVPPHDWVLAVLGGIGSFLASIWLAVVWPLGILGIITLAFAILRKVPSVRNWFRRAENWVFRTFLRPER